MISRERLILGHDITTKVRFLDVPLLFPGFQETERGKTDKNNREEKEDHADKPSALGSLKRPRAADNKDHRAEKTQKKRRLQA